MSFGQKCHIRLGRCLSDQPKRKGHEKKNQSRQGKTYILKYRVCQSCEDGFSLLSALRYLIQIRWMECNK